MREQIPKVKNIADEADELEGRFKKMVGKF